MKAKSSLMYCRAFASSAHTFLYKFSTGSNSSVNRNNDIWIILTQQQKIRPFECVWSAYRQTDTQRWARNTWKLLSVFQRPQTHTFICRSRSATEGHNTIWFLPLQSIKEGNQVTWSDKATLGRSACWNRWVSTDGQRARGSTLDTSSNSSRTRKSEFRHNYSTTLTRDRLLPLKFNSFRDCCP